MGKNRNPQQLLLVSGDHSIGGGGGRGGSDSSVFCDRCSGRLGRRCDRFSLKCVIVLVLGLAALLSWIFSIVPASQRLDLRYDAADAVKRSATIQASFKLQKPVVELITHIKRLEYDIYGEISVPNTKVVLLSMHKSDSSGYTNIAFGVLSDPSNSASINQVDQSLLRSLFVELFLQQSNLTLTSALFGETSDFEILKFPGGLTVIPTNSASIWQIPNVLFNFALNNSITEIQENSFEFREQLTHGLLLGSHENIYVQVSNKNGSTVDPQVTVQASVMSDFGGLSPERLKQLAAIITGSREKNLGLNHTVFGNVKSVSLSSYMRESIETTSPSPSPAPSPGPNCHGVPPTPSPVPSVSHPYIPGTKRVAASRSPSPSKGHSYPAPAPHLPPKHFESRSSPAFSPGPRVNLAESKSSRVEPPLAFASQPAILLWGALAVILAVNVER